MGNIYEEAEKREEILNYKLLKLLLDLGFRKGDMIPENVLVDTVTKVGEQFGWDDRDYAHHISALLSADFFLRYYSIKIGLDEFGIEEDS